MNAQDSASPFSVKMVPNPLAISQQCVYSGLCVCDDCAGKTQSLYLSLYLRYKVLRPLLKKHVHSQMENRRQVNGECHSEWEGGREGITVTERYEKPWENVQEIRESTAFPRKSHHI